MNRAVSGTFQPGVKENIAYFTHTERRHLLDNQSAKPPPPPPLRPESDVSYFIPMIPLTLLTMFGVEL